MNNYKRLFQKFFREQLFLYRSQHALSQEAMAEILHISPRSYADQEHGKYGFSALSVIYFLLFLRDDDVRNFLKDFQILLKKSNGL